ncbi:MAG: ROK family protein [Ilumatobacter sp.]|nr:ROK family protein [Ilumatobacter sp.]
MTDGFLAIDLGPSRLAAGVVDADGAVVVRDRLATPARNVWPALTQLVRRVVAANPSEVEPTWVGVTCPGPIDRGTGSMKPIGMPTWHDFPLRRELASVTELPVAVETAGRGLALAELWQGESASLPPAQQHFATLVLGAEADGGLVIGGRLADGLTGNLGQFGHLIVEPEGMPCPCGAIGCLTAYASVRGIESSINRELRRTPAAIVERTGIMVARACASIAAMLDVTDILVGGAVPSVLGTPFFDALAKELDQRSGLRHLAELRVRGVGVGGLGPLVAAAAVGRQARLDAARDADRPPVDARGGVVGGDVGEAARAARTAAGEAPADPTASGAAGSTDG